MKCYICPRECGADRASNQAGVCGESNTIYVARKALHMWEEPCISGAEGSGAVFFTGCPLHCIYCQNYSISANNLHHAFGKKMTVSELSDTFLHLQNEGANNINLVTPTHYSYEIIKALDIAKINGLRIPVVYNCSGYEKVDTLKALSSYVDIYLTDFKYMDERLAFSLSKARNYPEIAKLALCEMVEQCGKSKFDDRGMMTKGVIVRNLLLPGHVNNSKEVVRYVAENYGDAVYISMMSQYTPLNHVAEYVKNLEERGALDEADLIRPLLRKVTKREYERLIDFVLSLSLENVFIQEGDVAKESFIPEFC